MRAGTPMAVSVSAPTSKLVEWCLAPPRVVPPALCQWGRRHHWQGPEAQLNDVSEQQGGPGVGHDAGDVGEEARALLAVDVPVVERQRQGAHVADLDRLGVLSTGGRAC